MSRTELFNKWLEENYGELIKFPLQKLTVEQENGLKYSRFFYV